MKVKEVKVPTLLWYGDKTLTLRFPAGWDVEVYPMDGDDRPPIGDREIRSAFSKPIGSKTIGELAGTHEEAVIVVDDMTRATRAYQLVPHVLRELREGGISKDHVRFIVGLGAHGSCDRIDFVKKLGEEVVEQFPVYNHNPFGNLTYLGKTSRGTPVSINSEFMACDLRIGVGSIVPHPQAGFGGGAKIVLPGVASIETITHNHGEVGGFTGAVFNPHPTAGWGRYSGNVLRLDMEEAAKMAGLHVKVDAILNGKGQISGLFMGDVIAEFKEGVKLAKEVYSTSIPEEPDIVVANTYAKSNEASLAMWLATLTVRDGGSVVLIANAPDGQVNHYVYGKFGKDLGGTLYTGRRPRTKISRLIIYSAYEIRDPQLQILDPDEQIWLRDWGEVLEELKKSHGDRARVAVFPNTEIQIPPQSIR
jgi:nickel-dependent lactate racemase